MERIAVSVVVAVYNREELLPRCIDSLVFQTLDNIEIILVDDYSEDNSWQVMEAWRDRFPEKIRITKSEHKGVAHAKNTGIKVAKGEYIAFVDSDDYVDYKMLKKLYKCAEENDYPEMINSPIFGVSNGRRWKKCVMKSHETKEDYISHPDIYFFHGKLFRADVFEKFGMLPILSIGEDACWIFPLISNLETICYIPFVGYYYELSTNSICKDLSSATQVEDLIKGTDYILERTAPEYMDYARVHALRRLAYHSTIRPVYKDVIDNYIKKKANLLAKIEEDKGLSATLKKALEKMEYIKDEIPQVVYVNGFKEVSQDHILECERAFREKPMVKVLDARCCDISGAPKIVNKAYANGDLDFVGKYFAVKYCYEEGGIYIDEDIEIEAPFNMLINDPSFFGYETDEEFSEKIFGGCKGNVVLENILKTYEYSDLYDDEFAPLSSRIRTVLVGMRNIPLRSQNYDAYEIGFCVYSSEMFVCSLPWINSLSVSHYKRDAFKDEEMFCAPITSMKAVIDRRNRIDKEVKKDTNLSKDLAWVQNQRRILQEKNEKMQGDIEWLQQRNEGKQRNIEWLQQQNDGKQRNIEWLQQQNNGKQRNMEWLQNQNEIVKAKNAKLTSELEEYRSSLILRIAMKLHKIFCGKKKA